MKNKNQFLGWVVVGLSASGAFASSGVARDLAKVENVVITDKDLYQSVTTFNDAQKQNLLKDVNMRRQALTALIDREVLALEGERSKIDQEPEFKEAVLQFKKQLLGTRLVTKKLNGQITDKAAKRFYETHLDRYSSEQVRIQHILLTDEKEAARILKIAKEGKEDFQALAEAHSKDPAAKNTRGEVGYISHGRMSPEITEAAFSASPNEIIGPIQTIFGYHIVKVVGKIPGKPFSYSDVELKVKGDLAQVLERNYLENLKKSKKIEIDYKALEGMK